MYRVSGICMGGGIIEGFEGVKLWGFCRECKS